MFNRKKRLKKSEYVELEFKELGHKFYRFKKFDYLLRGRFNHFATALKAAELEIAKNDIHQLLALLKEAFNEQRFSDVGALIAHTEAYTQIYDTWKNVFQIGNALILIDNEPLSEIKEEFTQKKAELFEQSELVRSFFLHTSMSLKMSTQGSLAVGSKEDSSKEPQNRPVEEAFSTLIQYPSWVAYLSG